MDDALARNLILRRIYGFRATRRANVSDFGDLGFDMMIFGYLSQLEELGLIKVEWEREISGPVNAYSQITSQGIWTIENQNPGLKDNAFQAVGKKSQIGVTRIDNPEPPHDFPVAETKPISARVWSALRSLFSRS